MALSVCTTPHTSTLHLQNLSDSVFLIHLNYFLVVVGHEFPVRGFVKRSLGWVRTDHGGAPFVVISKFVLFVHCQEEVLIFASNLVDLLN